MKDNETLSGARDTAGGRGGFGLGHAAAFTPRMIDLRDETKRAVAAGGRADPRLQRPPCPARRPSRLVLDRFPHRRRWPSRSFSNSRSVRASPSTTFRTTLRRRTGLEPRRRRSPRRADRLRAKTRHGGGVRGRTRRCTVFAIALASLECTACPCCDQVAVTQSANRNRRQEFGRRWSNRVGRPIFEGRSERAR